MILKSPLQNPSVLVEYELINKSAKRTCEPFFTKNMWPFFSDQTLAATVDSKEDGL